MPLRHPLPLALVAVAAAALLYYWRTLGIGYLSDDFGMAAYLHRDAGTVDWPRVFADFVQPWGAPTLYRPLVSVAFGINWALGLGAVGFHVVNVLLVAIAAVATAGTAALLCPRAPARAALAAGLLLVLHPAMVEPATWIASRTSGLEGCFSTLALCAFAAHLTGRLRARWPYALLLLLALFSKEGALTLPLAFLCVDLLQQARRPWRQRLALHLPVLVPWLFHLGCRTLVLGRFSAGADPTRTWDRVTTLVQHAGELVTPPVPSSWWLALPLLLLLASLALASPARPLWFAGWLLAGLLPTSLLRDQGTAFHGRYVATAVPALAILCACAVWQGRARFRWQPQAGVIALLLLLLGWGIGSQHWIAQYQRAGAFVQHLQGEVLSTAAAVAVPGRPLGLLALGDGGIPISMLQQPLWPALGLRPFAPRDHAIVALSAVLDRGVAAEGMFGDPRPLRALLAAGASLCTWDDAASTLRRTEVPPRVLPDFVAGGGGRYAPASPVPALAIAAIEVQLPAPARECRLRLLGDLTDALAFGEQQLLEANGSDQFVFDLTPALAPMLWQAAALPFVGCSITVDGVEPDASVRVRGLAAPGPLPLPQPLHGAALTLDTAAAALRPPTARSPLRLYLLLPTGPAAVDLTPGEPLQFDAALRWRLGYAADSFGPCLVHAFWQTRAEGPAGPQRSELDWFTLR